jgi:hypothetical protein
MRQVAKLVVFVTISVGMIWSSVSHAAFFGLPRALAYHLERIGFDKPALPAARAYVLLLEPSGGLHGQPDRLLSSQYRAD